MTPIYRHLSVLALASIGAAAVACTSASGEVTGGELRFDASVPATELLCHPARKGAPMGTGHTWSELYDDYFGPSGGASCGGAKGSSCHESKADDGAMASNFICPPTRDACFLGMTKGKDPSMPSNVAAGPPENTILYQILRKTAAAGGGGTMPKRPRCAMDPSDLQRIADWIKNGAPNDGPIDAGPPDAPPDAADAGLDADAGPG